MKVSVFTVMLPDLTPEEAAEELQAAGYDGWLGIEDFSGVRSSREALCYNIAFIRDLLVQTAYSV